MVRHEDYNILNDNWNQSTQLTKDRAPCYNVDWDFEKLYSEAVGRKEKKKIIISFKKKKKVQPL